MTLCLFVQVPSPPAVRCPSPSYCVAASLKVTLSLEKSLNKSPNLSSLAPLVHRLRRRRCTKGASEDLLSDFLISRVKAEKSSPKACASESSLSHAPPSAQATRREIRKVALRRFLKETFLSDFLDIRRLLVKKSRLRKFLSETFLSDFLRDKLL
jgi:hypothetical protein